MPRHPAAGIFGRAPQLSDSTTRVRTERGATGTFGEVTGCYETPALCPRRWSRFPRAPKAPYALVRSDPLEGVHPYDYILLLA